MTNTAVIYSTCVMLHHCLLEEKRVSGRKQLWLLRSALCKQTTSEQDDQQRKTRRDYRLHGGTSLVLSTINRFIPRAALLFRPPGPTLSNTKLQRLNTTAQQRTLNVQDNTSTQAIVGSALLSDFKGKSKNRFSELSV